MKNMKQLSIKIKEIIDCQIDNYKLISKIDYKDDGSIVTDTDKEIQKRVLGLLKNELPEVKHIVAEESNVNYKNNTTFDLSDDYIILDPLDGTENFAMGIPIYGFALSVKSNNKYLDMIYIPSINASITNNNILKTKYTINKYNNIELLSTKCLSKGFCKVDNLRVLGSSAYMFYSLLTGRARKYTYCKGAKIWDCYTGIRLAKYRGLEINIKGRSVTDWLSMPTYLTEFEIKW